MSKTTKIAISLPDELLSAVEQERSVSGESRSELFRRAVAMLLRRRQEQEMSEQYIRAYKQMPETREEIAAASHAASTILAGESWYKERRDMVGRTGIPYWETPGGAPFPGRGLYGALAGDCSTGHYTNPQHCY